jgi:hypothetical protein
MIFDCGAWSYRNDDIPKISPESALDRYLQLAKPNDILIAPDHMLIPGVDLDSRRAFNTASAQDFLKLCPDDFRPMATLHGMDLDERIQHGKRLVEMGYRHIAIGGIAARASQKALVLSMVLEIRKALPDVWLHVLGLSSPPYAAAWHEYGVESFDGSSHFKQAFTGGAFFTVTGGKLKKWKAVRPGESVDDLPTCDCLACLKLRDEGIDTRSYGSNENNMGRAAHNMNMLMIAQDISVNGNTVLVSCVGKKLDHAAPACELYQSDWFRKARIWAEENGTRWYILSAKHGLIEPGQVVEPYEMTLNNMNAEDRGAWAHRVTEQIRGKVPVGQITFLAGKKYRLGLEAVLPAMGYHLKTPMDGLGIGRQLKWLNAQNQQQMELFK